MCLVGSALSNAERGLTLVDSLHAAVSPLEESQAQPAPDLGSRGDLFSWCNHGSHECRSFCHHSSHSGVDECLYVFRPWQFGRIGANSCEVVLSMAEMAIAIMVVSLPAMRSFLRRGSFFSLSKKSTSYPSRPGYAQRTPVAGSKGFGSVRSKNRPRVLHDEESGSEVELNNVARTDVIYATRRVSVQYSDRSLDISKDEDETHKQHFEAK